MIFPFSSPHCPRPGQGAVEQVPAEPLFSSLPLPASLFLSAGQGHLFRKNLCRDRCAYQTPALSPTPRRSQNYLLARTPRLQSSINYWKNFQRELLLADAVMIRQDATGGRSNSNPNTTFLITVSLYMPFKRSGRGFDGRGKASGEEIWAILSCSCNIKDYKQALSFLNTTLWFMESVRLSNLCHKKQHLEQMRSQRGSILQADLEDDVQLCVRYSAHLSSSHESDDTEGC